MIAVTATLNINKHWKKWFEGSCRRGKTKSLIYYNKPNIGMVPAFQQLYETNAGEDVIVFMHDDVEVHEKDWGARILAEFDQDLKVAIVGFGGALGIGVPDIYKAPYEMEQLARQDYYSNQRDWTLHGKQETRARDVAVIDGFVMAVRRSFLDQVGGWKWFPFLFHCYDTGLCLMAARHGWKVRMVGVDCTHHGGGTSCRSEYDEWCRARGTTMEREHAEPHAWMYEEFRDLLPLRIGV